MTAASDGNTFAEGEESLNDIRRKVRRDLCHFEGNAQGIRLVHTLMRMNLYPAQVGGILKYTRPAWWRGSAPETHNYLMKKLRLLPFRGTVY